MLGMVVSDVLFRRFPLCTEGELTTMKARLVSAAHLHGVARRLDLGDHLELGRGEEMSGGRSKKRFLVDAMEAVIAAIYLDGGLEPARSFIVEHVMDGQMVFDQEAGDGHTTRRHQLQGSPAPPGQGAKAAGTALLHHSRAGAGTRHDIHHRGACGPGPVCAGRCTHQEDRSAPRGTQSLRALAGGDRKHQIDHRSTHRSTGMTTDQAALRDPCLSVPACGQSLVGRATQVPMSGLMNPAEFANIRQSEEDFWWYRGMRATLFRMLDPHLAGRSIELALEAGCGTGYFSHLLQRERRWPIVPMDYSRDGLRYARELGVRNPVQGDITFPAVWRRRVRPGDVAGRACAPAAGRGTSGGARVGARVAPRRPGGGAHLGTGHSAQPARRIRFRTPALHAAPPDGAVHGRRHQGPALHLRSTPC